MRSHFPNLVIVCTAILTGKLVAQPLPGQDATQTPALESVGLCPGEGDCCAAHGGLGCSDFECCDAVCFIDEFCCVDEWNQDCAAFAALFCSSLCQPTVDCGQGDCCSALSSGCTDTPCCETVCTADPACCLLGWSASCAALALELCQTCQPQCPQPGLCCEAHFGSGGCERSACCQTVCQQDPTCCTGSWGLTCARAARDHCLNVCDCPGFGDFDGNSKVDLQDLAEFMVCFNGNLGGLVPAQCACADYDADGDSDLSDFAMFADLLADP